MKMRVCTSGLAVGVALTAAFTAAPASADDVVFTTQPSNFGVMDQANVDVSGTATNLVQRFVVTENSSLESLAYFGLASDVDVYITNLVGAGADEMTNVLWETQGYTAESGGRAWQTLDLGGLNLDAGTYFVVLASDDATGARWSRVGRTGATGVQARGFGSYDKGEGTQRVADLSYEFFEGEFDHAYALRITGTPIPAPGTFAAAGLGALCCVGRRRR